MKVYLVIEHVDVGRGYIPSDIHGVFKLKEKAEELKNKLLKEYEWLGLPPWEVIFIKEMELYE